MKSWPIDPALLRAYIGDPSQVAGTKRYALSEGRAHGLDAIDVKTGSGFQYTVLPGRAMDIAWAEYQGIPLAFISKGGLSAAQFHTHSGKEWLRAFYAGLLTTCGLTHAGGPIMEDGWDLGQHGRISNTPASAVSAQTTWGENGPEMLVRGTVREASIFGENLSLHRTVTSQFNTNCLQIEDCVVNEGFEDAPLMMLYHFNLGFPLVSPQSRLLIPARHTVARDEPAQAGLGEYLQFCPPQAGYREQVFFHQLNAYPDGRTVVAIVNDELELALYIRFDINILPCFTQWKMMGQQDYVTGLEPGNCVPEGRAQAREQGRLEMLAPGDSKTVRMEVGISQKQEIDALIDEIHVLSE